MSNGQCGRYLQRIAVVKILLSGWQSAWLGPWLEAMRHTTAARATGPRIAAQQNQHLTHIADAMAAR